MAHLKTHESPFTHVSTYDGSLQLPMPTSSTHKYPWSPDYPCFFINRVSRFTRHINKYHRIPANHYLLLCPYTYILHLPAMEGVCMHIIYLSSTTCIISFSPHSWVMVGSGYHQCWISASFNLRRSSLHQNEAHEKPNSKREGNRNESNFTKNRCFVSSSMVHYFV